MGRRTGLSFSDASWSPVWGCSKVGPGCQHCISEDTSRRLGFDVWGPAAIYREMGPRYWRDPVNWNRLSGERGERRRVLCSSMSDVFDPLWPAPVRPRLWQLIKATPNIDWILSTMRIGNAAEMLPADWGAGYPNVWMMATICNQAEADRDLPVLFSIPAKVYAVHYGPALGAVDWRPWIYKLDWIVGSGESRHGGCRECKLEWLERTAEQCRTAGVAYFNKQIGSMPTYRDEPYSIPPRSRSDDPAEWPEALRVRQFPKSMVMA